MSWMSSLTAKHQRRSHDQTQTLTLHRFNTTRLTATKQTLEKIPHVLTPTPWQTGNDSTSWFLPTSSSSINVSSSAQEVEQEHGVRPVGSSVRGSLQTSDVKTSLNSINDQTLLWTRTFLFYTFVSKFRSHDVVYVIAAETVCKEHNSLWREDPSHHL